MKRGNQHRAAEPEGLSAKPTDGILRAQQCLSREGAQRHDHAGTYHLDLSKQKRLAGFNLVWLGVPVLGRPALDDVGNVDLVARQIDGFDDLGQQLARPADKRNPLEIFVVTGCLTNEHQVSGRASHAKYNRVTAKLMELAARAVSQFSTDVGQGLASRLATADSCSDGVPMGLTDVAESGYLKHRWRVGVHATPGRATRLRTFAEQPQVRLG